MIEASGGKRGRRTWRVLLGPSRSLWVGLGSHLGPSSRWTAADPAPSPVAPGGTVGHAYLVAESVGWLRQFLAQPAATTRVRRLTLRVRGWRAPRPEWSGRLGPLAGLEHHLVLLPRGTGTAVVEIRLRAAVPLHDALSAALAVLTPVRPLPRPASVDVIALGAAPVWLPAVPNHTVHDGPLPGNEEIRAHDLVLAADASTVPAEPLLVGAALDAGPTGARTADRGPAVLIDPAVANPIGRDQPYGPGASSARLEWTVDGPTLGWRLTAEAAEPGRPERLLARGTVGSLPLAQEQLATVRKIANVRGAAPPGVDPAAEATLLAQLAATGTVLDVSGLPAAVADRLAEPLREVLTTDLPAVTADPLEWEIRSVRQRSAALRGHAPAFALGRLTAATFAGLAAPPSVSAILVTRRAEYIPDAIRYLAAQTYPELEIVLCLHGIELDAGLRAQVVDCGRPVEIFTVSTELSFGEVMGAATARARGSLVTKFDDDDVYGPEHVWDLVLSREYSGATLVGKAAEFVYLQTLGVTVRRRAVPPETYGPPVAGGTMLMSRGDLEDIGGWRPVPRSVDRGLMDRVLRAGGLIYRTHPLGYLYERRATGHTWDAGLDYFLRKSGQQWHEFPRHREFGTTEAERSVGS